MRPLRATFLIIAVSAVSASAAFTEKDVVGKWYRGDHLGYNVDLTLLPDHTHNATWTGDEIDPKTNRPEQYDSSSGTYSEIGL
jgi:hypothetical protein